MTKTPTPRISSFMGSRDAPVLGKDGTWLEAESFAYPNGAKKRRCRAKNVQTGELQVVHCGIPDMFFSIPCRGGGFITSDDGVFVFNPPKAA